MYCVTTGGAGLKDIRVTKNTRADEVLTSYLGIPELKVIQKEAYGRTKLLVVDTEDNPAECPECHKEGERFQYFPKEYYDCVVNSKGVYEYIIIDHRFVKCICRRHEGRNRTFSKEYDFAYRNANVTKRLENRIVILSMMNSCLNASKQIDKVVSRQAVGNIVRRWVERCDSLRGDFLTPTNMAVISGGTSEKGYVFFADIGYRKFRIIDVIAGIESASIITELRRFNLNDIRYMLTDSNTIIVDTLRGVLHDDTTLAVDVDSFIPPLNDQFLMYIKKNAKQIDSRLKNTFLLDKESLPDSERKKINNALENRKELHNIYEHVNNLRRIIRGKAPKYSELENWRKNIPDNSENVFDDVDVYIDAYAEEIINFYRRRTSVTEDVYIKIRALVNRLSNWSDRAPELMRARVLYSGIVDDYEELEERQWMGVSYDDVMENIDKLIKEGGSINE